ATTTLPPAGQAIWDALMARVMSTDFYAAAQGIDPDEGAAAALWLQTRSRMIQK
ncbi:unnamed protein product, partial [Umbelopsis vinacea]